MTEHDDTPSGTDLEGLSAVAYERRRKLWSKFNVGDWWIAVGVYLIFCSIAFVIL